MALAGSRAAMTPAGAVRLHELSDGSPFRDGSPEGRAAAHFGLVMPILPAWRPIWPVAASLISALTRPAARFGITIPEWTAGRAPGASTRGAAARH
jgi:hypothetical protein